MAKENNSKAGIFIFAGIGAALFFLVRKTKAAPLPDPLPAPDPDPLPDPDPDPLPDPDPDPLPDPDPGPSPGNLSFTFGAVSLSVITCPVATAWKTPVFTCDVRNDNNVPVTRVINMRYRRFKVRTATWYGPFDEQEGFVELGLDPGVSYKYKFEGHHEQWNDPGDWECDPTMGSTYKWEFWLEDDLGNRSQIAIANT